MRTSQTVVSDKFVKFDKYVIDRTNRSERGKSHGLLWFVVIGFCHDVFIKFNKFIIYEGFTIYRV